MPKHRGFPVNFAKSLKALFIEHLWATASVIGHFALLAPDQEDKTRRPELFY